MIYVGIGTYFNMVFIQYDDLYLHFVFACMIVREGWSRGGGGGWQLVPEGGISYKLVPEGGFSYKWEEGGGGGGGGGSRPPPKPMLDLGLVVVCSICTGCTTSGL